MLAQVVSFVDRQVITLLVQPIRADLQISDTQMSLLMGFAFAIFYVTVGVPIARLSDRKSRRTIIAIGIFLWSLATAACGLARNFWQLFLARIGVGVGEATLTPGAYSMIADYFPKDKLGRAVGLYATGVYFGAGLALILGGAAIRLITQSGTRRRPIHRYVSAMAAHLHRREPTGTSHRRSYDVDGQRAPAPRRHRHPQKPASLLERSRTSCG